MRVTVSWLSRYVEIEESAKEIAERLTQAGLEVSACDHVRPQFEGVITGRILSRVPHPKADRLWVCRMDTGKGNCTLVCGASNVREGDLVPLVLPGGYLSTSASVGVAEIQGIRSEGMLCSENELGLSGDHEGVMILPQEMGLGKDLNQALSLEDDILEVEVTPNRPDCLSVFGIAREIAASTEKAVRYPVIHLEEDSPPAGSTSSVEILEPERCHRYVARILTGIEVRPSPFWLRRMLLLVGIRPINAIVDITNFVMWECGQPLHAFDLDLLEGKRIVVRTAREGERFVTLDGIERTLNESDLMICDAAQPVALAGVMGGKNSEINNDTTSVLLESAFFNPTTIRRTSKRLALSTEASYRFEREIDKEGTRTAADRAAQMMATIAGGRLLKGAIDIYPTRYYPRQIRLNVDKTNRMVGVRLSKDEIASLLKRLEIGAVPVDDGVLCITPPSFRPDLHTEVDLIEEVARLVQYDRIPQAMPRAPIAVVLRDPVQRATDRIRHVLVQSGFHETIHYSFLPMDRLVAVHTAGKTPEGAPVRLQNPLSEEQAVLRTSLVPSLLETVARNLRKMNRDLRLFEIRTVFLSRTGTRLPEERKVVASLLTGRRYPDQWNLPKDPVDFFDMRGVLEVLLQEFGYDTWTLVPSQEEFCLHPSCCGDILIGTTRIGRTGKVHPDVLESFGIDQDVYLFELDFLPLVSQGEQRKRYEPYSKYPAIQRDVALVMDELVPFSRVVEKMKELADPQVTQIHLFDVYRGSPIPDGKMSMAFHITYQNQSRTLTDEEVNRIQADYAKALVHGLNAQLR